MTPEEWNRLFDVFHAAREKSGGERVTVLDAACGESTLLRKAVEELLREDEAANGFLSEPLFSSLSGESRASPVVPGQRLGRYITVALIGRGGMGEVWSAQDTDLDRLVALKFLTSETLAGLDPQQITREAKAASALNHHGIVTIHEVVQSGSTPAIVMELVKGKPLREVCRKPLPLPEVLAIGLQIAEALAAAHASGVIHGDIKPENIFVRPDHYVKLLDFGLARKVTTETIALGFGPPLGTLRYMSPEQARAEPMTPASDVFSLGLVLFELLAGRHAFPAASPLDTAQGILEKEAVAPSSFNPHVPARLDLLVRTMLAKDPSARPTAGEVVRTLRELQSARKVHPDLRPNVWKWVIAAVLLLAACFAGWRWKQAQVTERAPTFRQITTLIPENRATAAAISPDGKLAAYANVDGIFLRTIQNGDTRTLSSPGDYLVDRLAWFADGTRLVASGFSTTTNIPSIWLISTAGADPRPLRTHARGAIPSADGTQVAFLSQDWSEIWVTGMHGGEPRKVVAGADHDTFPIVFWSPDGRRLAFQRRHFDQHQYQYRYESVELSTGKVAVESPNLLMSAASALPDGRVMFLRWDNEDFTSSHGLYEMKTDLATGALQGEPRKVASLAGDDTTTLLGLSVAADGKQALTLMRSTQNSVFVGDFNQSAPRISNVRRLTLDEQTNFPHAWTADSRDVIFESNRRGGYDIFKQGIDQRTPEVIVATPMTEMLPQLSPDGHFVLYDARPRESYQPWFYRPGSSKLMRVPVEGGNPQEVPIGGPLDEFRCALGAGKRCVLRTTVPGESRTYYDLDAVRGKGQELARTKWSVEVLGDWDVSPDGTQVAIPNHDSRDARIRVVSLEPKANQPHEREVILPGMTNLRGLVWAADGHGWFVSVDTTVGNQLLYVYLDGRFQSLGDIHGWAVPSPDGRRVAFLNTIIATNAWLIERR
ncbi:MAG TPA: protein kinase [Acidobacteriaceae bacterium]|nr:protein kinase [Acidobacteriaceae bacterium]